MHNTSSAVLNGEPSDKEIWIRLGLAHAKKQDLPAALEAFTKVSQIDPEDLEMVANRITILKDLGSFDQAEVSIMQLNNEQQAQADVTQATAGLWMAQNKLVEATRLSDELPTETEQCWLLAELGCSSAGLRHSVAPYQVLQRGLCYEPNNADLQEALQQILAEMARPEAAARCRELWIRTDNELKASYLFSRQFLGIGTTTGDSKALADQARNWEQRIQSQHPGPLWADSILEPVEGRKLRVGYLSSDLANHPVGRFLLPVLNHNREQLEVWALSSGPMMTGSHSISASKLIIGLIALWNCSSVRANRG